MFFLVILLVKKGYKVFNLHTHDMQVSRDIKLCEEIFPYAPKDPPMSTTIPLPMYNSHTVYLGDSSMVPTDPNPTYSDTCITFRDLPNHRIERLCLADR